MAGTKAPTEAKMRVAPVPPEMLARVAGLSGLQLWTKLLGLPIAGPAKGEDPFLAAGYLAHDAHGCFKVIDACRRSGVQGPREV
jgi:hypothetical protein